MSDLTYVAPEAPARRFKVGDAVEVLDRGGAVLSTRAITQKHDGDFKTDCGRWWTRSGWFIGEARAWPFPSIRHAASPPRPDRD